jgi:hypothetical protein
MDATARRPTRDVRLWLLLTFVLFMLGVFASPGFPGENWGSRFLLTGLPQLALLSAYALETHFRESRGPWRSGIAFLIVYLAAASAYSALQGLQHVERTMEGCHGLVALIESVPSRVQVTDKPYLCLASSTARHPPVRYYVEDKPEDYNVFFHALNQLHADDFTFVGSHQGFASMALHAAAPPGLFHVRSVENKGFIVAQFSK